MCAQLSGGKPACVMSSVSAIAMGGTKQQHDRNWHVCCDRRNVLETVPDTFGRTSSHLWPLQVDLVNSQFLLNLLERGVGSTVIHSLCGLGDSHARDGSHTLPTCTHFATIAQLDSLASNGLLRRLL